MKKILLFTIACICTSWLSAQHIYKIKADSVLITNDSCNAELIIENSTKHVLGFLYNKGNGRTEFRTGSAIGDFILNQTSSDQSASFRISGSGLIKGGFSSPVGSYNERFGYGAMASFSSTGQSNTAVGYNALNALNGSSTGNTAIGHGALALTTSSGEQTAIGSAALYNHTTGAGTNTAIGYAAMYGSTGASGYSNVAIGRSALYNFSSGYQNIAIGEFVSSAITTGFANINIGGGGLSANATYNVGVGLATLGSTSGSLNTALGTQALTGLSTGSSNIGIGYYAGGSLTTGNNNVNIGKQAGYVNNGSNNTMIGFLSGYNTTGSGNVFLGSLAGHYETGSNKLYIDNTETSTPLIYGDFVNDTVRINGKFHANGPVKLDLGSDATGDMFYRNSSGQFTRLGIGTSGQVLTVSSGLPSWGSGGGGGGSQTLQQTFNTEVGGSVLTKHDSISTGAFSIRMLTSTASANPFIVRANGNGSVAVTGTTTGNGWGGYFESTGGTAVQGLGVIGVWAQTNTGTGVLITGGDNAELIDGVSTQSNTSTIRRVEMMSLISSGTVANGFGLSKEYLLETSVGGGSGALAGRDVTLWDNVNHSNRTSWRDFYGIDNAVEERFMNIQPTLVRINNDADTLATKAYARSVGGGGGGSSYTTVQEDGTGLTQRSTLDFNYGVKATDNSGSSKTDINLELSTGESFITSNVALTANTLTDITSMSLSAGTWFIAGSATVESPNNAIQRVSFKVWDDTNTFQAGEASTYGVGGGSSSARQYVCIPVSCLVVLTGTTTVKLTIASTGASNVLATPVDNNTGMTNKATSIRAVRIK